MKYYEIPPAGLTEETKWKVYLEGGFWKYHGRDEAGHEIAVEKKFEWDGRLWYVPSVYVCEGGLVVDYCIEAEPDDIRHFISKWEAVKDKEEELNSEERELLESENPLNINFISSIIVNGVQFGRKSGCSMSWIPKSCGEEGIRSRNEAEWFSIMKHYKLAPDKGWAIHRHSYQWDFKGKPDIKSLHLNLEQCTVPIPGMKFKSPEKGTEFVFTHPVTGIEHTVIISNVEKQVLEAERFRDDKYEYPTHFTMMSYTLTPDLRGNEFSINDCIQSDSPKRKNSAKTKGACAIGIIGGADGPAALFLATGREEPQLRMACSALHFEPVEEVQWQMICRVKRGRDISVRLI